MFLVTWSTDKQQIEKLFYVELCINSDCLLCIILPYRLMLVQMINVIFPVTDHVIVSRCGS